MFKRSNEQEDLADIHRKSQLTSDEEEKETTSSPAHGLQLGNPDDPEERAADRFAKLFSGDTPNPGTAVMGQTHEPSISNEFSDTLKASKIQGTAIDESTRNEIEQQTGSDLSDVRIHTDETADKLSTAIDSRAFVHGKDIYFGNGNYQPASAEGKQLIAHEAIHTQQQGNEHILRRTIDEDLKKLREHDYTHHGQKAQIQDDLNTKLATRENVLTGKPKEALINNEHARSHTEDDIQDVQAKIEKLKGNYIKALQKGSVEQSFKDEQRKKLIGLYAKLNKLGEGFNRINEEISQTKRSLLDEEDRDRQELYQLSLSGVKENRKTGETPEAQADDLLRWAEVQATTSSPQEFRALKRQMLNSVTDSDPKELSRKIIDEVLAEHGKYKLKSDDVILLAKYLMEGDVDNEDKLLLLQLFQSSVQEPATFEKVFGYSQTLKDPKIDPDEVIELLDDFEVENPTSKGYDRALRKKRKKAVKKYKQQERIRLQPRKGDGVIKNTQRFFQRLVLPLKGIFGKKKIPDMPPSPERQFKEREQYRSGLVKGLSTKSSETGHGTGVSEEKEPVDMFDNSYFGQIDRVLKDTEMTEFIANAFIGDLGYDAAAAMQGEIDTYFTRIHDVQALPDLQAAALNYFGTNVGAFEFERLTGVPLASVANADAQQIQKYLNRTMNPAFRGDEEGKIMSRGDAIQQIALILGGTGLKGLVGLIRGKELLDYYLDDITSWPVEVTAGILYLLAAMPDFGAGDFRALSIYNLIPIEKKWDLLNSKYKTGDTKIHDKASLFLNNKGDVKPIENETVAGQLPWLNNTGMMNLNFGGFKSHLAFQNGLPFNSWKIGGSVHTQFLPPNINPNHQAGFLTNTYYLFKGPATSSPVTGMFNVLGDLSATFLHKKFYADGELRGGVYNIGNADVIGAGSFKLDVGMKDLTKYKFNFGAEVSGGTTTVNNTGHIDLRLYAGAEYKGFKTDVTFLGTTGDDPSRLKWMLQYTPTTGSWGNIFIRYVVESNLDQNGVRQSIVTGITFGSKDEKKNKLKTFEE